MSDLADKLRGKLHLAPLKWARRPEVLLSPNIPRPMHGVAPREVLGAKWWNETRQAAYRSTAYHCIACGVVKYQAKCRQWLEGHELYAIDYEKGRMTYLETVPLCHFCHNYIHDGRLNSLLEQGKIMHQKFTAILQHGDSVLLAAGLKRLSHGDREAAVRELVILGQVKEWSKWRLVVNGRVFPPKYKSAEAQQKEYDRG